MKRSFAENMKIVQKYQAQGSPAVDVIALAKELGLKVYSVDGWNNNVSGMIKKNDQDECSIFFNAKHPESRQRFTIAHEIAHYILHTTLIGDGIADDALYRSGLSNSVEAEANALAADILMPREKIDGYWKNPKSSDMKKIAEDFKVSEQAMAIRLGVPSNL